MEPASQSPRVVLVSGIFYPDVGGPATHVRHIAEHFSARGWHVTVVAFGTGPAEQAYRVVRVSRRLPKLLSWARYALVVLCETARSDVVYAFDLTTSGLPAALAARICRKPFLLRIGGDPIWERAVERGKRFVPMAEYYERSLHRHDRPVLYRLICFVTGSASRIVTYTPILARLYTEYFEVPQQKITLIPNPLPPRQASPAEEGTRTFVFAGRFVRYKNLERVLRVFAALWRAHPAARLLVIGEGPEEPRLRQQAAQSGAPVAFEPPLPQAELAARVRKASVVLAPALTEFNPNFVLESLALGKPALISRGHGLSVPVPAEQTFDPIDDQSLYRAMERMLDDVAYKEAVRAAAELSFSFGWGEVLEAHTALLGRSLR